MARTRYTLNNLRPDIDYRLQLRAKVNGITGAWSSVLEFTTTLDETPPGPVTNLTLTYVNQTFVLSWDPPADVADGTTTDLANYKVYVTDLTDNDERSFDDNASPSEFSLDFMRWLFDDPLTQEIESLSGQWRFEVTAQDRSGNESERVGVEFIAEPPGPFSMLDWLGGNQSITITWEASVDTDLDHYAIYRDGVLVGRTISTELEFVDGNPGPGEHSYYAIAYDALGLFTQSSNTLTGAKTYGYWQGDSSVPKPPNGIGLTSTVAGAGTVDVELLFNAPVANEDDSPYEDHSEFLVQWALSLDGPWESMRVLDDRLLGTDPQQFELGVNRLLAGTAYNFRLQTIDRYSNKSAWAYSSHTTVTDLVAPSRPSAPVAAGNLLRVQITHDLTKATGGKLEADTTALKVYVGTSADFTPAPGNLLGSLDVPSVELTITGSFPVTSVTQRWVKVAAVDATGNESIASSAADAGAIQLISDLHVEQAGITSASIGSLSVSKLVAGDGVVNAFDIKSLLRVLNGGYVASENFNNNPANGPLAGYRLSEGGLEVYSGTVSAATLTVNNSPNLVPWAYSSFEHTQSYFFGGTDAGGNAIPAKLVYTANANTSQIVASAWEGERSLRFRSAVGTNAGAPAEILFTPTNATYQVVAEAASKYVVSFYSKSASAYAFTLVVRWQNGVPSESTASITIPASAGNWRRNYAVFTAPSGTTGMFVGLRTSNPNVDLNVDALQIELAPTLADALLTPSAWKSPGMTTIDGAQITTGEIKSTNYNAGSQTGWRIGLEGNLTAYNAFFHGNVQATGGFLQTLDVRGTVTVGSVANGLITDVLSRWYLRSSDGLLFASNANISGTINAVAGNFQGVTATDVRVGAPSNGAGYIKSYNWDPSTGGGWIISNTPISIPGFGSFQAAFRNVYVAGLIRSSTMDASAITGTTITGGTITGTTFSSIHNATWGRTEIRSEHTSLGTAGILLYRGSGSFVGQIYGSNAGDLQIGTSGYVYIDASMKLRDIQGIGGGSLDVKSNLRMDGGEITSTGSYVEFGNPIDLNNRNIYNVSVLYALSGTVYGGAVYGGSNQQVKLGNAPGAPNDAWVGSSGTGGAGLKFVSSEARVLNEAGSSYVPIRASSFPTGSSREFKVDIKDLPTAMDTVRQLRPKTYNHLHITNAKLNAGFIAEDLAEINERFVTDDHEAVDSYAILAYTVRALQELDARLQRLE